MEESINAIQKSEIIALKQHYHDVIVQKVLQLVCLIKGKSPTLYSARSLLNPLTFHLEFLRTNVERLRQDNIVKAYNYLNSNKDFFNVEELEQIQPAAARLLEWADNIMMLYKYRIAREGLEAMQRNFTDHKGLKSEGKYRNTNWTHQKTGFGFKDEYVQRKVTKTPEGRRVKRIGKYIAGKTFTMSNIPKVEMANLGMKRLDRQITALKRHNNEGGDEKADTSKDSAKLEEFLDKLAEHND